MESSKWFANKGQILQFGVAAIACILAGIKAFPDLQGNNFISLGAFIFYALCGLIVVAVLRLTIHGHGGHIALRTPTLKASMPTMGKDSEFQATVSVTAFELALGDIYEMKVSSYQEIRIELRGIQPVGTSESEDAQYAATIFVDIGGGLIHGGARTTKTSFNTYELPYAPITLDQDCTLQTIQFTASYLHLMVLRIKHLNPHKNVVTLELCNARS